MRAPLRVLGDRVLVKPDVNANAPQVLPSGVVLARSLTSAVTGADPTLSVHRGTVIAVGNPRHSRKDDAEHFADRLWPDTDDPCADSQTAKLLRDLVRREPCCAIDDDVLFAADSGQQVTLEGETYVILHETDLLAIVES